MFASQWRRFGRVAAVCSLLLLTACGTTHGRAQTRPFRVAYLGLQTPEAGATKLTDLRSVLNTDGWAEGRNYVLDVRWASGDLDRIPALAAELVQDRPDVIFGSDLAVAALHSLTVTIPVVAVFCGNPIHEAAIQSLAHPGGNVTGVSTACISGNIHAKDLELLRATVPGLHRVAVLWDPQLPDAQTVLDGIQQSAQALGLEIQFQEVQTAAELLGAVGAAVAAHAEALFAPEDPFMTGNEVAVTAAVAQYRLPAIFEFREFADLGALLSYGANLRDMGQLAFGYIKRILQGAKAADLPILQPTRFDLVVNLKTAQALGITIPDAVLTQATDVIR